VDRPKRGGSNKNKGKKETKKSQKKKKKRCKKKAFRVKTWGKKSPRLPNFNAGVGCNNGTFFMLGGCVSGGRKGEKKKRPIGGGQIQPNRRFMGVRHTHFEDGVGSTSGKGTKRGGPRQPK